MWPTNLDIPYRGSQALGLDGSGLNTLLISLFITQILQILINTHILFCVHVIMWCDVFISIELIPRLRKSLLLTSQYHIVLYNIGNR